MEIDKNSLTKEILIQFVNHENKATGPIINVPLSITKDNLDELINDLKKKNDGFTEDDSEDVNYSFMINNKLPIKNNLYDALKGNNISSENILSIKYFPLNIFKVKKISTCSATLPGHTNSILCLAFSPNSSHLATGSGDNTIRLWDINTQTPIATLKDHTHWVLAVLFSPDNKFLATASMDHNVCIYDTHTGKLLNVLTGHTKEVTTLCFEPLHLLKESNIKKSTVFVKKRKKIYKGKNGNEIDKKKSKMVENSENKLTSLQEIKNDVPSGDAHGQGRGEKEDKFDNVQKDVRKDGSIRINNILNNNVDKVLSGHTNTITCILWSGKNEKNSRIYSSSRDTTVKIWNVNEGTLLYDFKGHKHWVNCLSLNSERILKNGIYNLDVVINKIHIENHIEKSKIIFQKFLISQTNEKIVSGSDDGTLHLINCLKNNTYKSTRLLGHQQPVIHALFSPNGKFIASSSFDKSIKIWSGIDGTFLASYRGHVGPVYKITWSIDNNYVVSCSQDSTLKLWKVNHLHAQLKKNKNNSDMKNDEKEEEKKPTGEKEESSINAKNEQRESKHISKKKDDKKQLEKNKKKDQTLLVDLPGHADAIYAVDWSNDGRFVASGGKDKLLKIWSH
ncbi:ribosome assembly protein 4, putative [Plasmodium ovale]|uniref:Ribosome assembly protein 4, putative n=1 Tax=Plasmodium ovale TaxID=36330 RepID=A0A1D3TIL0_PLAOA|nr:ribosome assembly protein 4, putative [Plasmodium ovale]